MFAQSARSSLRAARLSARTTLAHPSPVTAGRVLAASRSEFHSSPVPRNPDDDKKNPDKEVRKDKDGNVIPAGHYARTDESIIVEFPPEDQLPSSTPVEGAGRSGVNVLPTLASFSLESKVSIVTGGARGLGLVMGQGIVISGGDLAIVDLNSKLVYFLPSLRLSLASLGYSPQGRKM